MTARNPLRATARSLAMLLTAAGALGCAAQPVGAQPQPGPFGGPQRATVTVSGSAEVAMPPDQAIVRLGVLAESATAAEAQQQVNETMRRLLRLGT